MSERSQEEESVRILTPLLFNPLRGEGETCPVCTTPTVVGALCHQCRNHEYAWGSQLADVVMPLTYASDTASPQIRRSLRNYKDGWNEDARQLAATPLTWLVWHALFRHGRCIEEAIGGPIEAAAMVPSGHATNRDGAHPVRLFGRYFPSHWTPFRLKRTRDAVPRDIDPDSLEVSDPAVVEGRRVLLFDDTWTTGASAQSAAIAVRRAGAVAVVVLVMGRWTDDRWQPTHDFFVEHRGRTWSPDICPVTGSFCAPTPQS